MKPYDWSYVEEEAPLPDRPARSLWVPRALVVLS